MKRLLLFLLLMLQGCCSKPPTVPKPISHCRAPAWPKPLKIHIGVCDDKVCFSVDDAKAQAQWVHDMTEIQRALAGCSLIDLAE